MLGVPSVLHGRLAADYAEISDALMCDMNKTSAGARLMRAAHVDMRFSWSKSHGPACPCWSCHSNHRVSTCPRQRRTAPQQTSPTRGVATF
ncbi:hypothetical protein Ga0080559_TMP1577 [Salipiger profundus]|uniref:Uncharacterized protein n=1 Tax=Salipiger profundus TaxID=1229727 RepID=A0A1U7D2N4_9RHOB|nr:hypothetical protein Ga0080559_TMP1577 [Salipiger profundus]